MIGLKRGSVKLSPYNPKWAKEFEKERERILVKLESTYAVDVQHIGSTSVPGLTAKPLIDMSLGVRRFKDVEKLVKPLRELGYIFDRKFQHQRFFAKGPDSKRTHYLHVMRYDGVKWRNDRAFREYLIEHPKQVHAYSKLKMELAQKYPNDRQKYSDGKDKFIKHILKLANK